MKSPRVTNPALYHLQKEGSQECVNEGEEVGLVDVYLAEADNISMLLEAGLTSGNYFLTNLFQIFLSFAFS